MWVSAALAGEGMWLPEQLPAKAEELRALGFELPAAALGDPLAAPLSAIAGLGFCSASFVSPDGLLLSNLHCVEGWVAQNSTGDHNLLADGFTAASRAEERPAGPSARVYVLESVEDVTERVRAAVFAKKVAEADRAAALDRVTSALVAECEADGDHACEVAAFDGGRTFRRLRSLELRDVRLVHSPADGLGYFGGDLDNFEWPRHDADYGIVRAYVGPDGRPADPAPENVPYRPRAHLAIATDGVKPGDPVLVAGYPGSTQRALLPEELRFAFEVQNPAELDWLRRQEALVAEFRATGPDADAHLQSPANDLANERKYLEGIQDGVGDGRLLAAKAAAAERALAGASPEARAAVDALRADVAAAQAGWAVGDAVSALFVATPLDVAHEAWRWSGERAKKRDGDREPGYQDRDREDWDAWLEELDQTRWAPYEAAAFREALARYAARPDAHVRALDDWLVAHGGPERAAAELFAATGPYDTPAARRALLDAPRATLAASADPWMALARLLEEGILAGRRAERRAQVGRALATRPAWVGLLAPAYPDANGTLRVTYGRIEGYRVRDGLEATPLTTLAGIAEKDALPDYEAPPGFVPPPAERAASRWADPRLGDVPVNFLSSLDTTGGNSGSATLDARGRLVGLVFDGNYESMAADWAFDPATTRSIHLDVRYVGWLLDRDPKGAWILSELGLAP